MIKKLRWKFVTITMIIVTILLVSIFVTLYYSTKTGYRQRSMDALHTALKEDFPGNNPPPPRREETPMLIADVGTDGTVKITKNRLTDTDSSNAGALISLVNEKGKPAGILEEQHLRYLRGNKGPDGRIRYVFSDIYAEQNSLRRQIVYSAVIGSCAFAAFFLFSFFLSGWAVKPVEKAWEQQRQFVADASHELKTPLTVILSNAGMMSQPNAGLDETNRLRIERIRAEAERMKQLVESLLTLARSDSGNASAAFRPLDLSFLVNSSIMTFEPLIFEMGKKISYEVDNNIRINGDEKKLRQLADILLDNACKYSLEGGLITVGLTASSGRGAVLSVANEGKALTEHEIKQLFHRFYRADPSRSDVTGYGLGLSIAESIVKEHGGEIRAESEKKGVNRFVVVLPNRDLIEK